MRASVWPFVRPSASSLFLEFLGMNWVRTIDYKTAGGIYHPVDPDSYTVVARGVADLYP